MQANIEKGKLVQALEHTLGVVDKKGPMPILAHCLVEANGDGLVVSATDLEISFRGTFQAEVQEPGSFTVLAHSFHALVKNLPETTLNLTGKEQTIKLEAGEAKYNFLALPPDQYPPIPSVPKEGLVEIEAKVLVEMIDKVIFSMQGDDFNYHLQAVKWEPVEKDGAIYLRLVSTDGHRLSLTERAVPGIDQLSLGAGILVPAKGMRELRRFLGQAAKDGTVSLGLILGKKGETANNSPKSLGIRIGEKELVVRLLEVQKYPDYRRIIPEKWEHHFVFNRRELAEAVKRVSLLTQERFRGVVFKLDGRLAELTHDNPEVGRGREVVELKEVKDISSHPKEAMEIGFNARYILEPLAAMEGEETVLRINDPDKPALWQDSNDARSSWLVMPMGR